MAITSDTASAVREVLDRFARAYEEKDVAGLVALCAADNDVCVVGTGVDEIRLNADDVRRQYERDLAEASQIAVTYRDVHLDGSGEVAWVLALCSVSATVDSEALELDLRLTGVLERRGSDWVIRQLHFSVPMAGQEAGRSFPTT